MILSTGQDLVGEEISKISPEKPRSLAKILKNLRAGSNGSNHSEQLVDAFEFRAPQLDNSTTLTTRQLQYCRD